MKQVFDVYFELFQQILCALAVLFSMVAAIPTGEKGELGSSVTGAVEDMDVAESKAKKYAKKVLKAQRKALKAQAKAAKYAYYG